MTSEFKFCPFCGKPVTYQFLFGLQRPVCVSCNWTHFADPKVAAAVFIIQDDKVLLTRRINEPYRAYWSLPAGFVNAHEDPKDAARRECLEETGLEIEIKNLIDVFAAREHERGADILIVYTAIITGGSLEAGDDADQAAFFSLDALPPLAFKSTTLIFEKYHQSGAISGV